MPRNTSAGSSLPAKCSTKTGPTRLELATSGVTGRRSNQLNYDPKDNQKSYTSFDSKKIGAVRKSPPRCFGCRSVSRAVSASGDRHQLVLFLRAWLDRPCCPAVSCSSRRSCLTLLVGAFLRSCFL